MNLQAALAHLLAAIAKMNSACQRTRAMVERAWTHYQLLRAMVAA